MAEVNVLHVIAGIIYYGLCYKIINYTTFSQYCENKLIKFVQIGPEEIVLIDFGKIDVGWH